MTGIYTSAGLQNMVDRRECVPFSRSGLEYLAHAICRRLNGDPTPLVWEHSSPSYCRRILRAFGIEMGELEVSDNGNYKFCITWDKKVSEKWRNRYYLEEMLSLLRDTYDNMIRAASCGKYDADITYILHEGSSIQDQLKDITDILRRLGFSVNLSEPQSGFWGFPLQFMNVKW